MSCRWPCEKLVPPADTCVSKETVVFVSMSVAEVEMDSDESSRSTPWMEGGRDVLGEVT